MIVFAHECSRAYTDNRLRDLVLEINDKAAVVRVEELQEFARDTLPELVEQTMSWLMGAAAPLERPDSAGAW